MKRVILVVYIMLYHLKATLVSHYTISIIFLTSQQESNRKCIERAFPRALIRSKTLNAHQCTLLVMFMMDWAEQIGRCPEDTEDKIAYRLELETCGGETATPTNGKQKHLILKMLF